MRFPRRWCGQPDGLRGRGSCGGTAELLVSCLDGGSRNTCAPSGEMPGRHGPARQRRGREFRQDRGVDKALGGRSAATADAPVRTVRPTILGKPGKPFPPCGPGAAGHLPPGEGVIFEARVSVPRLSSSAEPTAYAATSQAVREAAPTTGEHSPLCAIFVTSAGATRTYPCQLQPTSRGYAQWPDMRPI